MPRLGARLAYFASLGAGFMTIEITAIQAFTVFLGHPVYSMAITLTALLVTTGLGSALAGTRGAAPNVTITRAVVAIVAWAIVTAVALQPVLDLAIGWPLVARGLVVALWLAPAGLALGMPFPTAIAALEQERPGLVPWAWGVNGCFSVLSSLATVLVRDAARLRADARAGRGDLRRRGAGLALGGRRERGLKTPFPSRGLRAFPRNWTSFLQAAPSPGKVRKSVSRARPRSGPALRGGVRRRG